MSILSNILLFSGENTFVAGKVVGLKSTNRTVESADDSISFKITFDFEDVKNPEKKPRQNVGVLKTIINIIIERGTLRMPKNDQKFSPNSASKWS